MRGDLYQGEKRDGSTSGERPVNLEESDGLGQEAQRVNRAAVDIDRQVQMHTG